MSNGTVIRVENISKQYRLGVVGTGTLSHDLNRWWACIRGKEDPTLRVTSKNIRHIKNDSNYVWALDNINFDVHAGEVLGFIGRNGAGKSTLLKIISRITAPSKGQVMVKGRIGSLLEVGTGFHPELTGIENVYLNGSILGMVKSEIKKKLEEIVAFSGCERYINTPVKRYSSGMMVRLGFAVAAHLDPEILIVDEVLAVGDAEFQDKCIGKMKDVAGIGRTVIFVSHNMSAIRSLCDRVILLQDGKQTFEGNPHEVIESYLSQYNISTTEYDVRGVERASHLNQAVVFEKVELLTKTGKPRLKSDDPLRFSVTLKIHQDVGQYSLGFAILSLDGSPVGLCFSDKMLSGIPDENKTFVYEFARPQLAPGRYRCILSIGKGNEFVGRTDYDQVSDVLFFEILPDNDTEGRPMKWSLNWGFMRIPEPLVSEVNQT